MTDNTKVTAEDKEGQERPLLDNEQQTEGRSDGPLEISDEVIPFGQALKDSSNLAVFIVLGTLFHPMYSITNNIVLGHSGDETPLAGLGLGALTLGITGLSLPGVTGLPAPGKPPLPGVMGRLPPGVCGRSKPASAIP